MKNGCKVIIGGREYLLVYTADAYFDIGSTYGADFFDKIRAADRQAFDIAVGCVVILAREGELCRRYDGYEPEEFLTEDEVRRNMLPVDITRLKEAVIDAVFAGMKISNGKKKSGPVDVGLAEYEKKTEKD